MMSKRLWLGRMSNPFRPEHDDNSSPSYLGWSYSDKNYRFAEDDLESMEGKIQEHMVLKEKCTKKKQEAVSAKKKREASPCRPFHALRC
jgi:hypothetical protein